MNQQEKEQELQHRKQELQRKIQKVDVLKHQLQEQVKQHQLKSNGLNTECKAIL